jgi:aspartate kinase
MQRHALHFIPQTNRSGFGDGAFFGALGEAGINIRMITQSSQEISIILGVQNEDFEKAIHVIYDRFGDAVVISQQ